jgi:heme/copper-type cytochrome/quinol oxidase subunit 2
MGDALMWVFVIIIGIVVLVAWGFCWFAWAGRGGRYED